MTIPQQALRELVQRMAKARDPKVRTYMPTALLAVLDVAEQGKVSEGVIRVADYKQAFQRLMLEVWPTREDMWFRPMLHRADHGMWTLMLHGADVVYSSRTISRLKTEAAASALADAIRPNPVLSAALQAPGQREFLRKQIYSVLASDCEHLSSRLIEVHTHQDARPGDRSMLQELLAWEHRHEDRDAFEDLRRRQLTSRVARTGQADFRQQLLRAYERHCAMSDADADRALDAAHIIPFLGPHSNKTRNGLLLRGDLHTLFDDGLLTVQTGCTFKIEVHATLQPTVYGQLHGNPLRLPVRPQDCPDPEALDWHRRKAPPPDSQTP